MSDERLLKDLAHLARAREADGPSPDWERLAAGELTPDEVEHLRREAETSPAAAAAWEAFRPLDATFRSELVARIRHELPQAPTPARDVVPLRRAPAWLRLGLWPALAAASLLVYFQPWSRPEALPAYELRLSGALRSERSAAAPDLSAPLRFARGNRFELLLTPATSARAAVEARAFVARGEQLELLALPSATLSDDGALRIVGVVGTNVDLPEGESTVLVVVGRPGTLPNAAELRARLAHGSPVRDPHWSAWKLRLQALPGP